MNYQQHSGATEQRICAEHGEFESTRIGDAGAGSVWSRCPACKAAEAARTQARDAAENERRDADRKRGLMATSMIPPRYVDRRLETFRADNDGQKAARLTATRLAKRIVDEPDGGWSLILCGNVGTGKTHLACGIALAVIDAGKQARYETVLTAMRSIKATYSKDSPIDEQEAIDTLVNYDLLILDEVGVQTGTEYEKTLLFEVINERYQWRKSTILISNLTREALAAYLGERTIDRFRETGGVVPFSWESQRGKAR